MVGIVYIWCSLIANLWAILSLSIGLKRGNSKIIKVGRAGILIAFIFCTLAIGVLVIALIVNDFSFRYVAEVSNRSQPIIYRIAALWGGMSGSLLFWLWLLTIFSTLLVFTKHTNHSEHLVNHALLPLAVIQFFFNILVTGLISGVRCPFSRVTGIVDGQGMNPLLQTSSMIFHPPALYIGLTGFSIPFAYAIAALTSDQIQSDQKEQAWYIQSRRWTIFAWLALTLGIVLGGVWAYGESGWGGYWSWDAVENVSLISWLLATAFLHTTIAQEQRQNRFVCWNFISIALVFESTLFGTFITRSGIISSLHAFVQSAIGYYFLGFIILSSLSVLALMVYRWKMVRETEDKSNVKIISQTNVLAIANWLFLMMALVIFLGVVFPIVSRMIAGHEISLSEEYFNRVTRPFGLGLLLVMCVGIAFSRKKFEKVTSTLASILATVVVFIFLPIKGMKLLALKNLYLLICTFVFTFVIVSLGLELYKLASKRATGQNRVSVLITLIRRNKRRYGGYISHIGIAIIAIGILVSKGYQKSLVAELKQGESVAISNYSLRFNQTFEQDKSNLKLVGVEITITRAGKEIGKLYPAMGFYKQTAYRTPTNEVAIRRGVLAGLYVAFSGITEDNSAVLHLHYTPFVNLLWLGCIVILLGGLIYITDAPH